MIIVFLLKLKIRVNTKYLPFAISPAVFSVALHLVGAKGLFALESS
jgi:hypothetical protein